MIQNLLLAFGGGMLGLVIGWHVGYRLARKSAAESVPFLQMLEKAIMDREFGGTGGWRYLEGLRRTITRLS